MEGGADEKDTFVAVWLRELPQLRRYCLRWTRGNAADADEAVSRVAVRALAHFDGAGIADSHAWLRSIARNICIDLLRERTRAAHEPLDAANEELGREPHAVSFRTPEARYLDRERRRALVGAVAALPASTAGLLRLYYFEEMRLIDIARMTGMSEANVRRRIGEAHATLRARLRRSDKTSLRRPVARRKDVGQEFGAEVPRRVEAVHTVRVVSAEADRDVDLWLADAPRRLSQRTLQRLARYIERHPGGWRKRLEYARALRQQGELAAAAAEHEAILSRKSGHVAAWLELAETTAVLHGAAASSAVCRRGMDAVRGEGVEILAALADDAEGRAAEALLRLEALRTSASASYVGALAARIALAAGLFDRAAAALEPALRVDAANRVLLVLRHDVFTFQGRDDDALAALRAAVAADPANLQALRRLFLRVAAPARGSGSLRRLVDGSNGVVDARYAEGVQAVMRGAPTSALAVAAALVRERPSCALAWLRHAEIERLCGRAGEEALRRACALDAGDPRPRILLANALAARGETGQAAQLLAAAAELGPLAPISVVRLAARGAWSSAAVAAAAARVVDGNPSMQSALLPGRLPS